MFKITENQIFQNVPINFGLNIFYCFSFTINIQVQKIYTVQQYKLLDWNGRQMFFASPCFEYS